MTPEEQQEIIETGIKVYGKTLQLIIAMEELTELSQEVCKMIRMLETQPEGYDSYLAAERLLGVVDELADASVAIMIVKTVTQTIYDDMDIDFRIHKRIDQKLHRLMDRLEIN